MPLRLLGKYFVLVLLNLFLFSTSFADPLTKGIYLTQSTLQDTPYLNYLIAHAKEVGINTFIIDLDKPTKKYQNNIALVKKNNLKYVARIVMFPGGGTKEQIKNQGIWEKKYALAEQAVAWGADAVQLDYIRYNTEQPALSQNAQDIHNIIEWFKRRLVAQRIPLQLDIFGIASFGPSLHIGQDIKLFSTTADAICPMVYPSHFQPFKEHADTPYDTVFDALAALKEQFPNGKVPFKLYPYIELSNYHYKLTHQQRLDYIVAQIRAAEDVGADGWYVWSPQNEYDPLFAVLEKDKAQYQNNLKENK
jgi:hypothetical protein